MTAVCDKVKELLPELLRGGPESLLEDHAAHLEGCEECRLAVEGARNMRSLFAPPAEQEPPADLLDRTLDRCLLILPAAEEPAEEVQESGRHGAPVGAFRSSVEALTRLPLEEPGHRLSRGRLLFRAALQIAASVLVCVSCFVFWEVMRPAYTYARETKTKNVCHSRLKRLWRAARKYQKEQPNKEKIQGSELRRRLIKFGYADATDFHCPGLPVASLSSNHYSCLLPAVGDKRKLPVFWDKFNNHVNLVNVVFTDGSVHSITSEQLFDLLASMNEARSERRK